MSNFVTLLMYHQTAGIHFKSIHRKVRHIQLGHYTLGSFIQKKTVLPHKRLGFQHNVGGIQRQ